MSPIVVKCGGAVAESAAAAILELAQTEQVVVVHGAGPQISAEMERRGLVVQFVGGRRVTTKAGIDVVRSSMAEVNAKLCAAIGELALPMFGDVTVASGGVIPPAYFEPGSALADEARTQMKDPEIVVSVRVGDGRGTARIFGCDLSYDYVRINGEYTT